MADLSHVPDQSASQQAMPLLDNEAALADRLHDGDLDALAELFKRQQVRLLRMIDVRMPAELKARIDPYDVLQEAFIDASKRVEHFLARPDGSVTVWLRLIVLQRLQMVVRYHLQTETRDARREVVFSNASQDLQWSSMQDWVCDSLTSPSQAFARHESVDRVKKAIDEISALDREILILRHFEQLTNEEAAEVLGITVKAASNRYVRALQRLRQRLESE